MKPKSKIASFFNALFIDFRHFHFIEKIEKVVLKMGPAEKIFFYLACGVFVVSGFTLLLRVHNSFLVEVPSFGGGFIEGIVGSPRFINPILAISETDKDVASLVYSGLLKFDQNEGFIPDLADSFSINEDGTVYDVTIRNNVYFHDGKEVTADDVVFTIERILDPVIKSQKKASWDGVLVEKINEKQIRFTLSKPYVPFLESLTIGILPKHIWENASSEEFPFSEFNINPVGSGPYKIKKIERNSGGIPITITLSSWKKYALGRPKIKSIILKFFQNENELYKAYKEGSVESVSGLSQATFKNLNLGQNSTEETTLPRVFGLFLNQNIAPIFLNKEIREVLNLSAPRDRIVDEVLYGFGNAINGPTPKNIEENIEKAKGNIDEAKLLLESAGWKANQDGILEKKTKTGTTIFSFSIATSDVPELKKTAEILKEEWSRLGAKVDIKVFEAGDLSQNIIKGRKYDSLLFGEMIGADSDLYPFWHSSQRIDPGLNISLYANITVDKMLEEIQKETNSEAKATKKEAVISEIKNDIPAIFLFSPSMLYVPPKNVKNITLKKISSQSERFLYIHKWFIETDKVWKIFVPKS